MSCSNHRGDYFDYRSYDRLKQYYDNPYDSDTAKKILARYNIPSHLKKDLEISPKLLNDLAKNLASFGPSDCPYYHITCNYINYWLNQKIAHIYGLHDSNFDFFLKFADEFGKEKSQRNYKENSCSKYFSFLKDDKKKIIQTLYKIYDLYNEIIRRTPLFTQKHICSNFMSINNYYNILTRDYPNENELHKKLEQIKNLVRNESKKHEGQCDTNLSSLMSLQRVLSRPPAISNGQEQTSEHVGSRKSTVERLEVKADGSITEPELQSQGELTPSTVEKQQERVSQTSAVLLSPQGGYLESPLSSQGGYSTSQLSQRRVQPETVLSQYPEDQEESQIRGFSESTFPRLFHRKETTVEMDRQIDGLNYGSKDADIPPSQPEGIMHSLKGAFTDIVQNVDPAPVLGVSGGMGVLFILFKYTPFGSFFGRRRRRFRQISSSFGRFPPDFANFQEYDGGFIGYGPMNVNPLAE